MFSVRSDLFFNQLRPGQLLEELFESVPGARFFVKDSESRFVSANLSFARMFELNSVEELLGKTDFDLSADFLAEAFVADDRRVLETGKPVLNRVELVVKGSSLDWSCTSKMPLYNQEGAVIGLAGVVRSIQESDEVYHEHPELRKIVEFVQQRFRKRVTITDMSRFAGISASSVERLFRKTFGITPFMYLRKTRLNAACQLLRDSEESLSEIAVSCGFNDQAAMTRSFRSELNITPMRYRNRFGRIREKAG